MSVLVTIEVYPINWERFREALKWIYNIPEAAWISSKVYRAEDDPTRILIIDEWESHQALHEFSSKWGTEFSQRAGLGQNTVWNQHVWIREKIHR